MACFRLLHDDDDDDDVASVDVRRRCSVCECCHVHHARLQRRHSPYMKVQRPGFDLL